MVSELCGRGLLDLKIPVPLVVSEAWNKKGKRDNKRRES